MDFNLDDPLAGILSDGSDDSFFDDDIVGKKKPQKKKTTPIAAKKNALFDLGEVEEHTNDFLNIDKAKGPVEEDLKPFAKSEVKSPALLKKITSKDSFDFQTTESKEKQNITKSPAKTKFSTNDVLNSLVEKNVEKKREILKPLEKGKSSQSLLDDILGGASVKPPSSGQITRPTTAAKSSDIDLDSILGKSESKQTISSVKSTKQSLRLEASKPDTSQQNKELQIKKKSGDDWLGIFQDKNTKQIENDSGMPSWLVGSDNNTKKSTDDEKKSASKSKDESLERSEINAVPKKEEAFQNTNFNSEHLVLQSSQLIAGNNDAITAEGAALYLQQQESQLLVALQLKAQEEKLAAMQMRQEETARIQREAARTHQVQVESVLRRQAENRNQMQAVIAAHQDRITERIKALLGPPVDSSDVEGEDMNVYETKPEKRESPHVKEKKQLLQLIQTLQENHDKEIDLMETSYRRQLAFLEISLNQSEERMKEESEKVVKFYIEKITWLEEHHQLYKKHAEENLNTGTARHKAEIEMLREQYLENVRILREHHTALMENVNYAVKQEQSLIQNSTVFSSKLVDLVADVKESKSQFQLLVDKVQAIAEHSESSNEKSLHARELQINDMLQQIKKERENFEIEKNESKDMVKLLETRLKQMTSLIEEESAALKQKRMEFEFEKATFTKQTEFAKNVLKKQDEEIKMIRDDMQKEYQDKITRIEDEKAKVQKDSIAVAKEKSSIQSLRQELEKMKTELHAQLEEVNDERSKLNFEKQETHMEEQRILAKSRDLDLLAKTATEKQTQADKKMSEAEFIQRKYEERIRRMQEHVVSLNSREKQIAREKVALSRERLSIHNERRKLEGRIPCSLCMTSQNVPQYTGDMFPESFSNLPVSRDYTNANVRLATNVVGLETNNLLSRNYELRHTVETNLPNVANTRDDEKVWLDEKFETLQRQIGHSSFKEIWDPNFMMLRLDVQQVLSNLEQNKQENTDEENTSHRGDDFTANK